MPTACLNLKKKSEKLSACIFLIKIEESIVMEWVKNGLFFISFLMSSCSFNNNVAAEWLSEQQDWYWTGIDYKLIFLDKNW